MIVSDEVPEPPSELLASMVGAGSSEDSEPDARCCRDRPPAAVAEDAGDPGGVAGGEQALENLLAAVDRQQTSGAAQPQAQQRAAIPWPRRLSGKRTPQAGQETADRQPQRQHAPRHQGMEVGVALALQLQPAEVPKANR